MTKACDKNGRELHREFVGMLFALAIAEVAIRSAEVVNNGLSFWTKAPALSHLILAGMVIATSWVGWGRSRYSQSDVIHPFTKDFVELLLDVWLVVIYFFIVYGTERLVEVNGARTIQASIRVEALWILVMFVTYVLWDLVSKWGKWSDLAQRVWASILCAVLAVWTFWSLQELQGTVPVMLGDLCLLILVLLFRAMKNDNLTAHTISSWVRMVVLAVFWLASARAASYMAIP